MSAFKSIQRRSAIAGVLLLVVGLHTVPVQAIESKNQQRVKVAFLYQFARFAEWPQDSAGDQIITFGVIGKSPFGDIMKELEGRSVKGRRVRVVQCENSSDARQCELLFVSRSVGSASEDLLEELNGLPVLTVSDMAGFVDEGGMIQMFAEGGKIRFNINLQSAKDSSIRLSSKLLDLAKRVERE